MRRERITEAIEDVQSLIAAAEEHLSILNKPAGPVLEVDRAGAMSKLATAKLRLSEAYEQALALLRGEGPEITSEREFAEQAARETV